MRRQGKYELFFVMVAALFPTACEEPFLPELEAFDAVLVVEGAITDAPGPYSVRLSSSSGIYASDQSAVEEATVQIIAEDGDGETLTETEPGHYTTAPTGIQGTTGMRYKLSIQLQDGSTYETDYQPIPASIAIDTVGAELEYQYLSLEEPEVPGYQFHVTTEAAENRENYFLWSLEATYKYQSDFTLDYIYAGQGVQAYPNPTEFMTCWRTEPINEVFTFNTALLAQPVVEQLPLHFVRADQRELSIRYSLLVEQLTISEEAYRFWNKLQRQIENQESLYNSQPFQIRGNVYNTANADEAVLGFFLVAGQDEQRVYVDHPSELDLSFSYCALDYMSYGLLGLFNPGVWPIYIYEDDAGDRAIANDECFDCRELGGTIIQPAFWED